MLRVRVVKRSRCSAAAAPLAERFLGETENVVAFACHCQQRAASVVIVFALYGRSPLQARCSY